MGHRRDDRHAPSRFVPTQPGGPVHWHRRGPRAESERAEPERVVGVRCGGASRQCRRGRSEGLRACLRQDAQEHPSGCSLQSAHCDSTARSCRASGRGRCPFPTPVCVWLRPSPSRWAEPSCLRLPPGTPPPAAHCHRRGRRELRCRRRPALARCWLRPAYHQPSCRSKSQAWACAAAHRSAGCPGLVRWKSAPGFERRRGAVHKRAAAGRAGLAVVTILGPGGSPELGYLIVISSPAARQSVLSAMSSPWSAHRTKKT